MLFTQYFSRASATLAACAIVACQLPAFALQSDQSAQNYVDAGVRSGTASTLESSSTNKLTLVAQAGAASGAELAPVAVMGASVSAKRKDKSLLTDSLWGNLILEMAYQRDPTISKVVKKMAIMNLLTMGSISAIAGGTLAQGIVALRTLNPPSGIEDSYVPGAIGVSLSGATILVFAARTYFGHKFASQVHKRQLELKHEVEAVLADLEHSHSQSADAQNQLTELIGKRACNEWLELWRSSHQLAMGNAPKISLNTTSH